MLCENLIRSEYEDLDFIDYTHKFHPLLDQIVLQNGLLKSIFLLENNICLISLLNIKWEQQSYLWSFDYSSNYLCLDPGLEFFSIPIILISHFCCHLFNGKYLLPKQISKVTHYTSKLASSDFLIFYEEHRTMYFTSTLGCTYTNTWKM